MVPKVVGSSPIIHPINKKPVAERVAKAAMRTAYGETVVLSPECGLRKPDAEIYRVSSRDLGIPCEYIASVADNQGRDIEGAQEAGIACNVLYNSPEKKHPIDPNGENPPDAVINDFRELLDLFPQKEA